MHTEALAATDAIIEATQNHTDAEIRALAEKATLAKMELDHVRAHYQSLEYMLSSEDRIVSTVLGSWDAGAAPKPANIEEAIRLAVRAVGTEVLLAGYDVAHDAGMVQALYGFDNIQEALQHLYSDLDFSDPAYEVTDDQIAAFLNEASNPAAE